MTRPDEAPISRAELVEMFGADMPIEAVQALCDAGDGRTIGQVRAEIRRLGTLRRRERETAEAVRAVEQEWLRLLHEFGRAARDPGGLAERDAAFARLDAFEAEHPETVDNLKRRLGMSDDDA